MAGEKPADVFGLGAPGDDWPESPESVPAEDLLLEVDGPDVRPDSVDSIKLLAFASSYLSLLQKIALEEEIPISFRGLEIRDKCVAVGVRPDNSERVKILADTSASYIFGARPPLGLVAPVEEVRSTILAFPRDYRAKVVVGQWQLPLVIPEGDAVPDFPVTIETMRASVLRVGGAQPRVRLKGYLDKESFSVELSREQARTLAAYLYRDVDIVIRTLRTGMGKMIYCDLMEFQAVSDEDSVHALEEWFRPHAQFWDKVTDISEALGRRDRS